jgi:hypothetical protein
MSWTDMSTLRRIAQHGHARAPRALMLIVAGGKESWASRAWQYRSVLWPWRPAVDLKIIVERS